MNQYLEKIQESRKILIEMTNDLSVEQFNFIPVGYHNNIIWNMGHMITVSENILARNSDFILPEHKFDITLFGKNKKPEKPVNEQDISLIREALLETVTLFQKTSGIEDSKTMELAAGSQKITVGVLQFVQFHDGMHIKTIANLLQLARRV